MVVLPQNYLAFFVSEIWWLGAKCPRGEGYAIITQKTREP